MRWGILKLFILIGNSGGNCGERDTHLQKALVTDHSAEFSERFSTFRVLFECLKRHVEPDKCQKG